jgi:glucose/arabinose dehydrogenase
MLARIRSAASSISCILPESRLRRAAHVAVGIAAACVASAASAQTLPPGFVVESIETGWQEVAGVAPLDDGRVIAWERGGRVWMIVPGDPKGPQLMLDIAAEVGGWRDYGLLSVLPHPDFLENGQLYLLYVVDRHHLMNFGTPAYNPAVDEYFAATIGRVARFTATAASNFTFVDPATRTVLLGESKTTGIPIVHQSHGVGMLVWGEDGTLLVSTGDSASYNEVDLGGQVGDGYVTQALADGILRPKEDIGSYRSQLIDCLDGKILRIDPATGDGVSSNPWFDRSNPRSASSRVWCLGLRNPFRIALEAGTGHPDPAMADPGTLIIGDVGWVWREEWNRAETGGLNFGWPIFEGLTYHPDYARANVVNQDAANPLAGTAGCGEPAFYFRSLMRQDSLVDPPLLNPCAMVQAESAAIGGGAFATTEHLGYSGNGYVDFTVASGQSVTFTVTVPTSGTWTIGFRYAVPGSKPTTRLLIDGAVVDAAFGFDPTGGATEWRMREFTTTLAAGSRTVRIESQGSSGPNLDGVAIYAPGQVPVISSVPTFEHARPRTDWGHGGVGLSRIPLFGSSGAARELELPASMGTPFGGWCAVGGPRVNFPSWPAAWRDRIYVADFVSGWVRAFRLDASGNVNSVGTFVLFGGNIVAVAANETEETLWLVRWPSEIVRVRYTLCIADLNADGTVDAEDLAALLGQWGQPGSADLDGNGSVDSADLAILLGAWEGC